MVEVLLARAALQHERDDEAQDDAANEQAGQLKKSMVNLSVQDVPNGRVAPLRQEARGSIQQVVVASIY